RAHAGAPGGSAARALRRAAGSDRAARRVLGSARAAASAAAAAARAGGSPCVVPRVAARPRGLRISALRTCRQERHHDHRKSYRTHSLLGDVLVSVSLKNTYMKAHVVGFSSSRTSHEKANEMKTIPGFLAVLLVLSCG